MSFQQLLLASSKQFSKGNDIKTFLKTCIIPFLRVPTRNSDATANIKIEPSHIPECEERFINDISLYALQQGKTSEQMMDELAIILEKAKFCSMNQNYKGTKLSYCRHKFDHLWAYDITDNIRVVLHQNEQDETLFHPIALCTTHKDYDDLLDGLHEKWACIRQEYTNYWV